MGQWSNRQWGRRVCRFHIPGGTFQVLKYPSESKDEFWGQHGTFIILAAERLENPQHCGFAPKCSEVVSLAANNISRVPVKNWCRSPPAASHR